MLTQNQINQIKTLLKLEKITVVQRVNLIMFPTVQDDDFNKNMVEVKKKLRKISPNIDVSICSEGVLEQVILLPEK